MTIIATPTNYSETDQCFDTSTVESVLAELGALAPRMSVVIKSTVPVGFTQRMREAYPDLQIAFTPEFLREGKAFYDCLPPSRIIVGGDAQTAKEFEQDYLEKGQL